MERMVLAHVLAVCGSFLVLVSAQDPDAPYEDWSGLTNPGRTAVDKFVKSLPELEEDPAMTGEDPTRYRHPRVRTNFMWLMMDSVVVDGKCICLYETDHPTPFDHGVGGWNVHGDPAGPDEWSIREICTQRAAIAGEDFQVQAVFNDIQCGHGPPIETDLKDEQDACRRALFISDVNAPYITNEGTEEEPCFMGPEWDLDSLGPKTSSRLMR
ncbi:unnamed protein product [Vitrella brassicaformis CCMP3155]|uniref:Uncharacterized protein n=1 Tax=Vitrella brassicaformis (strain CCMP3155) TaxID=1169540 RepID=A0A0G4ETQ4_VITBC|nr:unnamed protein product [Vitrella brassicaformis CCMP3155]|eukprot:CEM02001.1 unnamed protein product [Vitrella brassicaformis CCMP3155]